MTSTERLKIVVDAFKETNPDVTKVIIEESDTGQLKAIAKVETETGATLRVDVTEEL